MGAAPLPRRIGQHFGDGVLDAFVGVTGDEEDATKSAGFKSWKKPFHDALDSAVATCMPSISRYPSALTPVASSTEHLTTLPPSRTLIVSAS